MHTFTDPRDGETYKTVEINGHIWLAESLRYRGPVKKFNNWVIEEKDFCNSPNGESKNIKQYGCLYTWDNAIKAVPEGWHLPSKEEFEELLVMARHHDVSRILSGVEPAGYCAGGSAQDFGTHSYFWSSTEMKDNSSGAYSLYLAGDDACVHIFYKAAAFSVRCIKD